jgi:hypothetical protein
MFVLRAIAPMFSMWPYKRKLDEKKSKHLGLVQQIGFGPTFLQKMQRLVKGIVKLNTYC